MSKKRRPKKDASVSIGRDASGNVIITGGTVYGNVFEKDDGNVIITDGIVYGDVTEEDYGRVTNDGLVYGNIFDKQSRLKAVPGSLTGVVFTDNIGWVLGEEIDSPFTPPTNTPG